LDVIFKAQFGTRRPHFREPVGHLESDGSLELPEAQRAEVAGGPRGFLIRVGAIHRAVVVDAVLDAIHVPDLMDHDVA